MREVSELPKLIVEDWLSSGNIKDVPTNLHDCETLVQERIANWVPVVSAHDTFAPLIRMGQRSWITCGNTLHFRGQFECGTQTHYISNLSLTRIPEIYPEMTLDSQESAALLLYACFIQATQGDRKFREGELDHQDAIVAFMNTLREYVHVDLHPEFSFEALRAHILKRTGSIPVQADLTVPVYSATNNGCLELGSFSLSNGKVIYTDHTNDNMYLVKFKPVQEQFISEVWQQLIYIPMHLAGIELTPKNAIGEQLNILPTIAGVTDEDLGADGIARMIKAYVVDHLINAHLGE